MTAVLAIAVAFAGGMIATDTLDSQIVARLLRRGGSSASVRRYRRAVGWLIVALSFGMAAHALAERAGLSGGVSDTTLTLVGAGTAAMVVLLLLQGRRRAWRLASGR